MSNYYPWSELLHQKILDDDTVLSPSEVDELLACVGEPGLYGDVTGASEAVHAYFRSRIKPVETFPLNNLEIKLITNEILLRGLVCARIEIEFYTLVSGYAYESIQFLIKEVCTEIHKTLIELTP